MKKHQLVAAVGTLALVANLLIPGLTFAAANQTGQATIICNNTIPNITIAPRGSFNLTPNGVQLLSPLYASSSEQNAFSNASLTTTNSAGLGGEDFIEIEDTRDPSANAGLNACNNGVKLEVVTGPSFTDGVHTPIPLANIQLVTSADPTAGACPTSNNYAQHGNICMQNGALFGKGDGAAASAWTNEGGFTTFNSTSIMLPSNLAAFTGAVSPGTVAQPIFKFTHNLDMSNVGTGGELYGKAGVAMAYHVTIPAGQPAGTYLVGITYTVSAGA